MSGGQASCCPARLPRGKQLLVQKEGKRGWVSSSHPLTGQQLHPWCFLSTLNLSGEPPDDAQGRRVSGPDRLRARPALCSSLLSPGMSPFGSQSAAPEPWFLWASNVENTVVEKRHEQTGGEAGGQRSARRTLPAGRAGLGVNRVRPRGPRRASWSQSSVGLVSRSQRVSVKIKSKCRCRRPVWCSQMTVSQSGLT